MDLYIDGVLCAAAIPLPRGEVKRVECVGTGGFGRVLRFEKPGDKEYMSLCEVEVMLPQDPDADGYYPSARPWATSAALKHALKLIAMSPDFHTTSVNRVLPHLRPIPEKQPSFGRDYKAVIVVFLEGGADSYNIVVPHSGCGAAGERTVVEESDKELFKDDDWLYQEYVRERGSDFALKKGSAELLEVDVGADQICRKFGLHKSLPFLRDLYDSDELAIVANMGGLIEPITLEQWQNIHKPGAPERPPGVFAHNSMQKNAWTTWAGNGDAHGVLGRMVEKMVKRPKPMKSALYSLYGYQRMVQSSVMTPEIINAGEGVVRFRDYAALADEIAGMVGNVSESMMSETFAALLQASLRSTEELGEDLGNTTLTSGRSFATEESNTLAKQFNEVAKIIQLDRTKLEMERSAFYTRLGGWDTHGTVDLVPLLFKVNEALELLVAELKSQGVWDDTTIVVASDFGRTLTSNSQGSDHGWGGNYFVMGGGVKGKQMLGTFPERLTEFKSEVNVGRGRFIPTTPWEAIWNAVSEWWGIDDAETLADLLPHAKNFPPERIFKKAQLFK